MTLAAGLFCTLLLVTSSCHRHPLPHFSLCILAMQRTSTLSGPFPNIMRAQKHVLLHTHRHLSCEDRQLVLFYSTASDTDEDPPYLEIFFVRPSAARFLVPQSCELRMSTVFFTGRRASHPCKSASETTGVKVSIFYFLSRSHSCSAVSAKAKQSSGTAFLVGAFSSALAAALTRGTF